MLKFLSNENATLLNNITFDMLNANNFENVIGNDAIHSLEYIKFLNQFYDQNHFVIVASFLEMIVEIGSEAFDVYIQNYKDILWFDYYYSDNSFGIKPAELYEAVADILISNLKSIDDLSSSIHALSQYLPLKKIILDKASDLNPAIGRIIRLFIYFEPMFVKHCMRSEDNFDLLTSLIETNVKLVKKSLNTIKLLEKLWCIAMSDKTNILVLLFQTIAELEKAKYMKEHVYPALIDYQDSTKPSAIKDVARDETEYDDYTMNIMDINSSPFANNRGSTAATTNMPDAQYNESNISDDIKSQLDSLLQHQFGHLNINNKNALNYLAVLSNNCKNILKHVETVLSSVVDDCNSRLSPVDILMNHIKSSSDTSFRFVYLRQYSIATSSNNLSFYDTTRPDGLCSFWTLYSLYCVATKHVFNPTTLNEGIQDVNYWLQFKPQDINKTHLAAFIQLILDVLSIEKVDDTDASFLSKADDTNGLTTKEWFEHYLLPRVNKLPDINHSDKSKNSNNKRKPVALPNLLRNESSILASKCKNTVLGSDRNEKSVQKNFAEEQYYFEQDKMLKIIKLLNSNRKINDDRQLISIGSFEDSSNYKEVLKASGIDLDKVMFSSGTRKNSNASTRWGCLVQNGDFAYTYNNIYKIVQNRNLVILAGEADKGNMHSYFMYSDTPEREIMELDESLKYICELLIENYNNQQSI